MNTPLYLSIQAGFLLLTLLCVSLFVLEFRRGVRLTDWDVSRKKRFMSRMIFSIVIWSAFVTAWSHSGKMADFSIFPLNLMPVIVLPFIMLIVMLRSREFATVLRHIPADRIIRMQSFRFFVEVLLWLLLIANLLPVQMTFEGRNFDILAGISAPVVAVLVAKGGISRTAVVIWNFVCLALLLNIVITAILSTPSPWRVFMNEPANYIVTYFPISLLPGLLVPLAYYLHAISLKQAFDKRSLPRVGD